MRTTRDLIAELQDEAQGAVTAALIVGFESTTLFLEAADSDPLGTLDEMVRSGGEPVGIMRVTQEGPDNTVSFRPLLEYSTDEDVQAFLRELSKTCVRYFGRDSKTGMDHTNIQLS